ncbi:hypothetical protein [Mycoplasmoides fastidiosum]|uniref:hypothetical protein n=1 Tax=Mycoplasmoides fastidiosum TaxID=92758 RepID=UPI002113C13D|nr:hypothetical protein [Mycoplasmoides fastidiosum]UUD37598.1 hypothetical protein NPA10_03460 [Mycoplasmoides fastidiosum]
MREIKEVAGTKNLKRITFWAYQKLMEEEVLNYLLYEKVEVMEIKDKFPSPKIPKMCDLTEMTQKIIENQEIFKSIKPKILIKRQGALICYLCFLLTVKRYPEIVSKEKFLNQIIDINEDIIIKNLEKYSESEIEFIKNNIVASDWK